MRWWRCLCFLLCLSGWGFASGPDEDWIPVSQAELQMKAPAEDPGARAVQLYYADYINQNDRSEFVYRRIKVLTEAGREYANVEITLPFLHKAQIQDLHARTILGDGKIVVFTGNVMEKIVIKGRGYKVQAQTFTFPDVGVGTILEYKYRIKSDEYADPEWLIQQDLYTVRESFLFLCPHTWLVSYRNSPGLSVTPDAGRGGFALEMRNVPAFEPEVQMPPEDQFRQRVSFLYGMGWSLLLATGSANKAMEEFIRPKREIRDEVGATIGGETDLEKKLRKLYARAQQIRNLSYERNRTAAEQKKEQLQSPKDAADVLKHGYGDRNDITLLFVAMARASGFDATVLLVAGRQYRLFDSSVPAFFQIDSQIAVVKLNGRQVFLDPGTRFCPYGLLRWMRTATKGVQLAGVGETILTTPPPLPVDFMINRRADMTLANDGSIRGKLVVEYRMGEALERRLEALSTDDAGRNRQLEDEIKEWLPADAVIKLVKVEGWESSDTPLVATVDVQIPNFASVTGKRILCPTFLFEAKPAYAFTAATRRYAVYFHYPFDEIDTLSLVAPAGFEVEGTPGNTEVSRDYASYDNTNQRVKNDIIVSRNLTLSRMMFPINEYSGLKSFFDKVREGDEQQIVFRPTTAAVAPASQ